jgi:hypothetical protein
MHSFSDDLQEEMGEMEGMGHRESKVIYVAEAAFPMFLISKDAYLPATK